MGKNARKTASMEVATVAQTIIPLASVIRTLCFNGPTTILTKPDAVALASGTKYEERPKWRTSDDESKSTGMGTKAHLATQTQSG